MKRETIDEMVELSLEEKKPFDGLKQRLEFLYPGRIATVRESVKFANEVYMIAKECEYFRSLDSASDRKLARQEYAMRTGIAYMSRYDPNIEADV